MVSNLGEAGGFVRSQESEPVADLQWHFLPAVNAYHGLDLRSMFRNFGYSITINENRPLSRGTLTLQSADPLAPPLIDPNYGAETREIERLACDHRAAVQIAGTDRAARTEPARIGRDRKSTRLNYRHY